MFHSPLSKKFFNIIDGRYLYTDTLKMREGYGGAFVLTTDKCIAHWVKHTHLYIPAPLPNPASPESVRTGDILCCICFEIISYNRWVLFREPASQSATAPRALMAAKTPRATELAARSNSQLSAHRKAGARGFFYLFI